MFMKASGQNYNFYNRVAGVKVYPDKRGINLFAKGNNFAIQYKKKLSPHVETVVLLSQLKQKPDDYINVTIELDDMDITSAETKATYDEIKKYVAEHNAGMKVSNLYISQVKRKCGIEVGKNYNLPKNEDSRQPQCPEDKESAIVEALKHFEMNS